MVHSFSTFQNFHGFSNPPHDRSTHTVSHSSVLPAEGGWRRADRACSTFPSDGTEGIKTVSNIESVRQEGAGQWRFASVGLQTHPGSELVFTPAVTTVPGNALTCYLTALLVCFVYFFLNWGLVCILNFWTGFMSAPGHRWTWAASCFE